MKEETTVRVSYSMEKEMKPEWETFSLYKDHHAELLFVTKCSLSCLTLNYGHIYDVKFLLVNKKSF